MTWESRAKIGTMDNRIKKIRIDLDRIKKDITIQRDRRSVKFRRRDKSGVFTAMVVFVQWGSMITQAHTLA